MQIACSARGEDSDSPASASTRTSAIEIWGDQPGPFKSPVFTWTVGSRQGSSARSSALASKATGFPIAKIVPGYQPRIDTLIVGQDDELAANVPTLLDMEIPALRPQPAHKPPPARRYSGSSVCFAQARRSPRVREELELQ